MEKIFVIGENIKFEADVYDLLVQEGYEVGVVHSFDYTLLQKERCVLIISEIPSCGIGCYFKDLIVTFQCKVMAVVEDEMLELQECADAGVHDYIFLPLRKREFLMKIQCLLRKNLK